MHKRRRLAAAAAAVVVVSIGALSAAPGAVAAPVTATPAATPAQPHDSPVTVELGGVPAEFTAGSDPVELTAMFRNSADHEVTAQAAFVIGDVNSGVRESEVQLQVQAPGSTQWQNAALHPGSTVGAFFELTPSSSGVPLKAGESVVYRLRLSFGAQAHPGRATAGLNTVVQDPSLPPEQRVSSPAGNWAGFTILAPGGRPVPPAPPAPAAPALGVEGVPGTFVAGAAPQTFRATVANHSGQDIRFLPYLTLHANGPIGTAQTRAEFQDTDGSWLPAVGYAAEQSKADELTLFLRTESKNRDVVALHDGESRTITVRLSFAADAPLGAASVALTGWSLPPEGSAAKSVEAGSKEAVFTVTAPAAAAGSPTAPPSAGPTAAAGVGISSTVTIAVTATATATATVSTTATATVSATAPQTGGLAQTGGGSDSVPTAAGGAAAIAAGVGMMLVVRRRKAAARTGA